jgi:hypothetical protein
VCILVTHPVGKGCLSMKRAWLYGLAVALVLAGSGVANAAPVTFDVWYGFAWSGNVVPDGDLPTTGTSIYSPSLTDPGASPWTFTAPAAGAVLTVTDLELDVDSFAVFDFGGLVGNTPLAGFATSGCTATDPNTCIAAGYSHGSFLFAAGPHSITLFDVDPNGFTGDGAFRLDAVPEPASLILLGSGLAGLGFARRRKAR